MNETNKMFLRTATEEGEQKTFSALTSRVIMDRRRKKIFSL